MLQQLFRCRQSVAYQCDYMLALDFGLVGEYGYQHSRHARRVSAIVRFLAFSTFLRSYGTSILDMLAVEYVGNSCSWRLGDRIV